MDKLLDHIMELQASLSNNNETLKMFEREQRQAQNSLDNLLRAVEQGIVNQTTNRRMQELEEQLVALEKQILIEKSKMETIIPREQIKQFYEQALRHKPEKIVSALIDKIQLYNDKMKITLNSPLKKSPDDNNQGSFYITEMSLTTTLQHIPAVVKLTTLYIV